MQKNENRGHPPRFSHNLGMGYVFVILKIPSNAGHNLSCNEWAVSKFIKY